MGPKFFETAMGRQFIEGTMKEIIQAVKNHTKAIDRQTEALNRHSEVMEKWLEKMGDTVADKTE